MADTQVLVVEDRRELADLYSDWLRETYTVYTTYSGTEALDALENTDIDIVLLDRRMPGLSGDDVLAQLDGQGDGPQVGIVTAVEPDFDVVELDFDDYVTKPVSREDLHGLVERLLRRTAYDDSLQEYFSVRSLQETLEEEALPVDLGDLSGTGERPPSVDMSAVDTHTLPDPIEELATAYESRIGHRDRFLLRWLHTVFPFFTLSSVETDHEDRNRADKTLASLFVMLLDDLGERHGDFETLAEVAKLPVPHQTPNPSNPAVDDAYFEVTEAVWDRLQSRLADAPRYDEIADLLRFDLRHVVHAIRYSALVSTAPRAACLTEATAVDAHNMMMLAYADIDLAYSPTFDSAELGSLRDLILRLQQMARIGNWITTWERELEEGDFSSGVVVYALENGIVSPEDLQNAPDDRECRDRVERTIRNAAVEEILFDQWRERYTRLCENPPEIDSIDVTGLLDGMSRVMAYHLASRGLK